MNRFERFLAEILLRKYAIKICSIFPPHLASASALPGEIRNLEIASYFSLKWCMLSAPKTHKTNFKTSPGGRNHPSLSKRLTVCTRYDLGREPILQYVTLMLDVYKVCHCVGYCVKN